MTVRGAWGEAGGMRRCGILAVIAAGFSMLVAFSTAPQTSLKNSAGPNVTIRTLAEGSVAQMPAPKVFVGILDFRQVPGAACGPACRLSGFVYTLRGVATVSVPAAAAQSVSPGHAVFTPAIAMHTNDQVDGRIGAGIIAAGLIVVVILLCAATWLRGGRRRTIIAALSVLLIAVTALVLTGATSNEWYFVAVRPASQLSLPMPRPDGRVTFASADLDPVPVGPYIETLREITVPRGARYDAPDVSGPETILVLVGDASIDAGDGIQQLASGQGALTQTGKTLVIVNPGSDTLRLLDFAITHA